ncbi:double-strand break repair helicase AddA [Rhodobacteraceae bacterium D3-12]|nr:double-strand break repair helicase AddA [Rhodobacteraceae bacterium D3-12]
MTAMNDATRAQITAALPDQSTWLAANAGSGKTKVLTDRVARLLLDEVNPQHILCLTYTKAAASEMQNRLFRRLGKWAMLPDADLRKELAELGISGAIDPIKLAQARRLFARAIETPGGLKIQTIHAFCSSILRRFPLEAGISPRFTEMDDRSATLLRQDVIERMALGAERPLVQDIARYLGADDAMDTLTQEICKHAESLLAEQPESEILSFFDLPEGVTASTIESAVFLGSEQHILDSLIPALKAGSSTDQKNAAKLSALTGLGLASLPVLESVFLNGKGAKEPFSAKLGSFPTKGTQAGIAAIMPELENWMQRVESARTQRLGFAAARQTIALHRFARAFLTHYEAEKLVRGWLDFDDLINRARLLLNDDHVAAWVLYRLDGGIDHILVDEAQDTSPAQWNVIDQLAREFTSGQGARADITRTIFVVGDKKQSIYSFQGADPREFDRMRAEFGDRLATTDRPLQNLMLEHSFRSSHAILSLVDATFEGRTAAGFTTDQKHRAFFDTLPGRIDIWPPVEKSDPPEDKGWNDPVDLVGPEDPDNVLAKQIASEIKSLIGNEHIPVKQSNNPGISKRLIHAGDFLVLVQRRSRLFHAIIRECKAQNLPIAGADRLRIGGELAVRDITALLKFLATPEDDLSLAAALKSPLFGWSEQELFTLAQGRKGFLWAALRDAALDHPETLNILDDLRRQTDYLRPYDLIERILTRHNGRLNLLGRLGQEAEDGIDALLAQSLAYDRGTVPSLTGFLVWLETDEVEIKRQMEGAGRQIRVMTVHAAKGLEAPIVILPDTGRRKNDIRAQLLGRDPLIWKPRADDTPPQVTALIDDAKQRNLEERDRLLYVAMTRAEKWLIVASTGDPMDDPESWYYKIQTGMTARGAEPKLFAAGNGLRLEHGDWAGLETFLEEASTTTKAALPPWHNQIAPIPEPRAKSLSPSDLGGAKALPGEAGQDEDAAKRYGRQIHRLLEFLPDHPQENWPATAQILLRSGPDAADDTTIASLLQDAKKVLTNPDLAALFSGNALAEVPVAASLPELNMRQIHGIIDRLIISDTEILAVDFKSNAVVPATPAACPDGLLRQMGAYQSALTQVFPGKIIATALLWTRNATLMRLPHDLVIGALTNTQMLDPTPSRT